LFFQIRKQITEFEFQRDQLQKTNHQLLQEVTSLKSNIEQQINEREKQKDLNESSKSFNRGRRIQRVTEFVFTS
jgi:hypothetical protein